MRNWGIEYLDFPVARTLDGNCVAFVKKVLREQYRKEMPSFLQVMRMVKKGEELPFKETKILRDGTLVACGNRLQPVKHVGLYSKAANRVIHALPEAKTVRAEPLYRLKAEWPLVTLYELVKI